MLFDSEEPASTLTPAQTKEIIDRYVAGETTRLGAPVCKTDLYHVQTIGPKVAVVLRALYENACVALDRKYAVVCEILKQYSS